MLVLPSSRPVVSHSETSRWDDRKRLKYTDVLADKYRQRIDLPREGLKSGSLSWNQLQDLSS